MSLSELLSTYGQNYVDALLSTWGMTALCFALVMALAVGITVLRVCPFKPLRWLGDGYVQVFRNIPGVSLLIIIVYALPSLNLVLPYRTCVILTVVLVASAFGSENFMSGINTIGVGQIERRIVIPQALRTTVLPMTNLLIAVMLTTSLGSQVPLDPAELTGVVSYINTRATGGILAFAVSAAGYALTAVAIAFMGNRIDRKVRIAR